MIKKIKRFIIIQRIHLLGWGIYMILETFLVAGIMGHFGKLEEYVLHYILNIILFYTVALILLPAVFENSTWKWKLPVFLFLVLIVYFFSKFLIDLILAYWNKADELPNPTQRKYILSSVWRCFLFSGLGGFYFLFRRNKQQDKKAKKAEQENYEAIIHAKEMQNQLNQAEAAYLRAQINPHLLFNTISFIYNQVKSEKPAAAKALATLSDVFRFSIDSERSGEKPMLAKEIKQVRNLLTLSKMRTDGKCYLNFQYEKEIGQVKLIPLILITLAENVFKHGDLRHSTHPGIIKIWADQEYLHISTHNKINAIKLFPSLNLGLSNLERRLELAYQNNYLFEYTKTPDDDFIVNLSISLSVNRL